MTTLIPAKETLYQTAMSRVNAVGIKEGDFVAIRHFYSQGSNHYYMVVNRNDSGDTDIGVVLPSHQLGRFCL